MARIEMKPMSTRLLTTLERALPRVGGNWLWIAVPLAVLASVVGVVVSVGLLAGANPEQKEAGTIGAGLTVGGVESLIMLDWDAGTADWENITDDSVVGEIQFRNPVTLDTVATIATGYDPQIAVSGDGSRLALAETASVGLSPVQRLRVFDLVNGQQEVAVVQLQDRLLTTGDVAPGAVAMSHDGRYAFVESYDGNHYWIDSYDIDSNGLMAGRTDLPDLCGIAVVLPFAAEANFVAVCKGPAAAAVIADPLPGTSTTVEFERVTESINGIPVGRSGADVVAATLSPDGPSAHALARDGTVHVIDVDDGSVTDVVGLEIGAGEVSPDQLAIVNGFLYVGVGTGDEVFEGRSSAVRVFDAGDYSLEGAIDSPMQFSSFSVSPDQQLIYLVDRRSQQLMVIDGATGEQVEVIEDVGQVPDFVALR